MTLISIAAFIGSYFSVFHALRVDLFCGLLIFIALVAFFTRRQSIIFFTSAIFIYFWTSLAIYHHKSTQYTLDQKATVVLDLKVIELPNIKANAVSFIARPVKIIDSNVDYDFLKLNKIKINWYHTQHILKAGDIWRMKIRLQAPHGYQNEGGFDYERWMFAEGISATAYVLANDAKQLTDEPYSIFLQIRSWLAQKINQTASEFHYLALFKTLSIGDKTQLDPKLKQLFVETGTAHLLVISGLHVGLLSLLFYFLAGRVWFVFNKRFQTKINQQDFSAFWAMLAAIIYAALAGFSLPTIRALIMLTIVYVAMFRRYQVSLAQTLSIAVSVVLLLQPLALLSFSFWLSFSAILLIVISQYVLKDLSKLKAILILQLLFSFLFIPLNAVVFNQFIASSFLANLVLIPSMSFIVIPINLLASVLTMFDWQFTIYIYFFLDFVIDTLVTYLNWLNDISGGAIVLTMKQSFLMLLSAIGAILCVFFLNRKTSIMAFLLMILPWFYWQDTLENGDLNILVFDVGMGTSVLVTTQNHYLLYDLGPGNKSTYQPAKWVVLPYLQSQGIKTLDKVIVSHTDQDHYGGIWPLMKSEVDIVQLVSGDQNKMKSIMNNQLDFLDCHAYPDWHWDGVSFKFLALKSHQPLNDNNHSCVLSISSNHGSVLLTGDIERLREDELIKYFSKDIKADILLVPHHGSKTSSSNRFIETVKPKYAVVTTGYLNRWKFPKFDIKQRYQNLGIHWFNTGLEGSVLFKINQNGINVETYRDENNFIWN